MLLLHKSFKNKKLELSDWHFGHINVFIFALWSEIDPKEVTLTDELSYVKSEVIVMKNGLFATSTDDIANPTVVAVSMGLLLGLGFYILSTDEWSDTNRETSPWI